MTNQDYEDLIELLNVPYEFTSQPAPIPVTLRPDHRIPVALLLVAKSHGSGAGWQTLQLLNWSIRDAKHAQLLMALRERSDIPDRPIVRFDPALDRALDLAVGLGFLEQKAARVFRLTEFGKNVVDEIELIGVYSRDAPSLTRSVER